MGGNREFICIRKEAEEKVVNTYTKIFRKHDLWEGRLITGSKSGYSITKPSHLVVYNANAIIRSYGKIWHGDLDLTLEWRRLRTIAEELKEPIYILWESDARFGTENDPIDILISKAVWSTDCDWTPTKKNYLTKMG